MFVLLSCSYWRIHPLLVYVSLHSWYSSILGSYFKSLEVKVLDHQACSFGLNSQPSCSLSLLLSLIFFQLAIFSFISSLKSLCCLSSSYSYEVITLKLSFLYQSFRFLYTLKDRFLECLFFPWSSSKSSLVTPSWLGNRLWRCPSFQALSQMKLCLLSLLTFWGNHPRLVRQVFQLHLATQFGTESFLKERSLRFRISWGALFQRCAYHSNSILPCQCHSGKLFWLQHSLSQ